MESERQELMDATRRALCEHGYADLTMQRIADESPVSTAALHYHYDTKADLLDAFLESLLADVEARLDPEVEDPRERLHAVLDGVFGPAPDGDGDFAVALFELKAQAPYQDAYRERLVELDRLLRRVVADVVRDGVAAGVFADCDPDAVAQFVATAVDGAHARGVALDEDPARTRQLVETHLERRLEHREVPA